MSVPFRLSVAACLLVACHSTPNAKQAGKDTGGTPAVTQDMHGGDMYYEARISAASSPGRIIALTLHGTGDAELVTDYLNEQPEIVAAGPWQENGDQIKMVLTRLNSHAAPKDTLIFRQEHHQLIYEGRDYGSEGLKLKEKTKPAPKPRIMVMWVAPEKIPCTASNGETRQCLQIAFGRSAPKDANDWQTFDEDIKGFSFQPGKLQLIKVLRTPRRGQLQDESQYSYQLQQVMK